MSEEGPSKTDIGTVFKRLRSIPSNKVCFDCGAKNPTWASVTYGVFICIDCSAIHRGLGVHLSFVRSTQLDTNWQWLQLRAMQVGGNSNATQFFRQHGCTSTDAQQKYNSRAASLYRDKLHHLAVAAMRLQGARLHLDSHAESTSPAEKEADFFEEVEEHHLRQNLSSASLTEDANLSPKAQESAPVAEGSGPNVDHLFDESAAPVEAPKCTIGQRKAQPKKTVGGKKAFSAQKVSTNFSEIEKEAESIDQRRAAAAAPIDLRPKESDGETQHLSARLMVQEVSVERKKQEEKLKQLDPKKGEQVDRLGMGVVGSKTVLSHSIANDMKSIQQEGVPSSRSSAASLQSQNGRSAYGASGFEDDWEVVNKDVTSGSTNSRRAPEDDFFSDFGVAAKKTTNWAETDESNKQKTKQTYQPLASNEAQQKFGSKKAISSDEFFGGKTDFETRANFSRFEGSNSISSADFFGDGSGAASSNVKRSSSGYSYGGSNVSAQLPDMGDISDSVRQGVTKVASKLSRLSTNVSSYISKDELAMALKKHFDKAFSFEWHVVVGRGYGVSLFYDVNSYICFYVQPGGADDEAAFSVDIFKVDPLKQQQRRVEAVANSDESLSSTLSEKMF